MARIPEAEIERLKNEISVQRLVESAGIALKKIRQGLRMPMPVSCRRYRQPGGHPGEESLALLRLRYRRWPD